MATIIYDSLDEIPKEYQGKATEKDGKFEMDAAGLLQKHEQLKGKVAAFKDTETRLATITAALGDKDPSELVADLENAQRNGTKAVSEAVAAERQRLKTEHAAALEQAVAPLKSELQGYRFQTPRRIAAEKAGIKPNLIDMALKATEHRFKFDEATGKTSVLDAEGDPIPGMTPEKFYTELFKEEAPELFPPSGAAGSGGPQGGSRGNGNMGKSMTRTQFDALPPLQQAAAAKEYALVD